MVGHVSSLEELRRELDSAHASVGLVIDRDFGKDIHRGKPAQAFLIVNASDTTTSSQAMSIASGIANGLSIRVLARRAGWAWPQLPIDLRVRPWYNPDLKTATFIIPGLIAIILTFTLIQFTASAIVRERERGTLEQLQVTPATRVEIILGKILPFTLIGYVQLTMTVLLMRFLFGIVIQGSVVELYLVGLLFIAAVLGLGMLISTVAKTQMQAMQMSTFVPAAVRLPLGLRLPDRRHAGDLPVRCPGSSRRATSSRCCAGIILRGAGLGELWQPVAWLTLYTVLIIGLAVARFKKTTE